MEAYLKGIGAAILLFITPVVPLLLLIGFAILIDTIFGIIASKKNNEPILSSKLARLLTKSLIYLSLVLLAFGLDYVLIGEILINYFKIHILFTKLIGVGIIFVECFSIDEKIRKMNDNKGLWYYFKLILAKGKQMTASIKDVKKDIDELKN